MKKLLYVVTQGEWGGAQRYIFDLATNIPKNQFSISVALGSEGSGELKTKLTENNIPVITIKNLIRNINPIKDIKTFIELFRLIKKEKPDIIHLNSSKAGILGSIAARFAKTPNIIYTAHGWVFNEPLPYFKKTLYYILEKFTANFKSKIICVSDYDRKVAIEKNIAKPEKLIAIHNGIDVKKLHFYSKAEARSILSKYIGKSIEEKTEIIGTIGNLYKTKGHTLLIKAAEQIPDKIFIIIGDGPERKNLESIISNLNLKKRVFIAGYIDDAHRFLKGFDLFILPSLKEGFPYIILEAIAAKIPIIASGVGGIPEILPESHCISPIDTKTIVKALEAVNEAPSIDMEHYTLLRMINETLTIYTI